jgi:hypothetical protein
MPMKCDCLHLLTAEQCIFNRVLRSEENPERGNCNAATGAKTTTLKPRCFRALVFKKFQLLKNLRKVMKFLRGVEGIAGIALKARGNR